MVDENGKKYLELDYSVRRKYLDKKEYVWISCISSCISSYEIWHKLLTECTLI
jgi:hypothetical protein